MRTEVVQRLPDGLTGTLCPCRSLIEVDDLQEGAGLIRRRRHGTDELSQALRAGRGLKDIRQGLPDLDIGREAIAAKDAVLEAEVGRVLLQWGQSTDSLQEMLIQVQQPAYLYLYIMRETHQKDSCDVHAYTDSTCLP